MDDYAYGLTGWNPDALAVKWHRQTDPVQGRRHQRIYALLPTQRAVYYQWVSSVLRTSTSAVEVYIN